MFYYNVTDGEIIMKGYDFMKNTQLFEVKYMVTMTPDELEERLRYARKGLIHVLACQELVTFELPPFEGRITSNECKKLLKDTYDVNVIDFKGDEDKDGNPVVNLIIEPESTKTIKM